MRLPRMEFGVLIFCSVSLLLLLGLLFIARFVLIVADDGGGMPAGGGVLLSAVSEPEKQSVEAAASRPEPRVPPFSVLNRIVPCW